jgi:hypothetical protein
MLFELNQRISGEKLVGLQLVLVWALVSFIRHIGRI